MLLDSNETHFNIFQLKSKMIILTSIIEYHMRCYFVKLFTDFKDVRETDFYDLFTVFTKIA